MHTPALHPGTPDPPPRRASPGQAPGQEARQEAAPPGGIRGVRDTLVNGFTAIAVRADAASSGPALSRACEDVRTIVRTARQALAQVRAAAHAGAEPYCGLDPDAARDLHDLLGYGLSAITLKAELALRLLPTEPERARRELTEVARLARRGLREARTVGRGGGGLSLAAEAASARSVLASAGIRCGVRVAARIPDAAVETVLATVLREGVTNILRHSTARSCGITAGHSDRDEPAVRLCLVNDGVTAAPGPLPGHPGGGLENLAARLAAVGGRLSADVLEDGIFQLLAEVPHEPPPTAARTTG
jgi:glucose-6-phosphate-specific signal transduction histidine kinase